MELEFEFELSDWIEFQKNYLKNSKQFQRTKIIVLAMLPIVFTLFIFFDLINSNFNPITAAIYIIVSVLWILFYANHLEKRTLQRAKKMFEEGDNSGMIGKHKIILNDNELVLFEPESEQKIQWSGIKKIEEDDKYYFLYNTSISAIIIPKFKVSNDLTELDDLLKKKHCLTRCN